MMESRINTTLFKQIQKYFQTQLKFKSDVENFRFEVLKEETTILPPVVTPRQTPTPLLLKDNETQFSQSISSLNRLMFSLPENKQIF